MRTTRTREVVASSGPAGEGAGVLDAEYHHRRLHCRAPRYRLRRRTDEVLKVIQEYLDHPPRVVLDLGCADGLMLDAVHARCPASLCVGLDRSMALLAAHRESGISLLQGDASALPFTDGCGDVVIATALIEHLVHPRRFLQAARGVLRAGGLLVMTTPAPFWERVATAVGHLDREQHHRTYSLAELSQLLSGAGFEVVLSRRFMLSPVSLPAERAVEAVLRGVGLGRLLANQLLVGVRR